ncbi:MAG: hypothetical protein WD469_07970 [Paenibacillaceae bacterium]
MNTVVPELVEKGIRFIALAEDIDTDKAGWQSKLAMYSMVYQMTSQTTVRLGQDGGESPRQTR